MSRDVEAKNDRLFDKRTIERNIKKGLLSRKDYEKHLKGLDDVAPKGVFGGPQDEPEDVEDDADGDDGVGTPE